MKVGKLLKCLVPVLIYLGINAIAGVVMLIPRIVPAAMEYAKTMDMDAYVASVMSISTDAGYIQSTLCVTQIITFIVFSLIYFCGMKSKFNTFSGHFKAASFGSMLVLFVGVEVFISSVLLILTIAAPSTMEYYNNMIASSGLADMSVFSTILTLVLAPIVEEIIFRGITLKWAQDFTDKFWLANLIQALLFGIAHLNVVQGLYAFVLALILGYVRNKYKSLWASIFGHLVFNFCGTYIVALLNSLFSTTIVTSLIMAFIAAALAAVGFFWDKKIAGYAAPVSAEQLPEV